MGRIVGTLGLEIAFDAGVEPKPHRYWAESTTNSGTSSIVDLQVEMEIRFRLGSIWKFWQHFSTDEAIHRILTLTAPSYPLASDSSYRLLRTRLS